MLLRPNENGQTDITNNPQLAAFAGLMPGQALDLDELPIETALGDPATGELFTPQGPITALMAFRQQFPYVPVIPFPPQVRTIVLAGNAVQDIEIPDMVEAVLFRGSSDYYICDLGNADIPTATNISKSIYKPDGIMFYTGGKKSMSVIAPAACIVTMLGYAPSELPRYGR